MVLSRLAPPEGGAANLKAPPLPLAPNPALWTHLFFWLALPICSLAVICCDAIRFCYYHGCWLLLLLIYVAEAGSRQEALDSFRRAFSAGCLKCLENQVLGGKP